MVGRNQPRSPGEEISDTSRMSLDKNSSTASMSRKDDTHIHTNNLWVSHATVGSGLGAVDASGILSIHIPRMKITSPSHSWPFFLETRWHCPLPCVFSHTWNPSCFAFTIFPPTMTLRTDASGSEREPDSARLGLVDLLPDHPRSTVNEIDGPLPVAWKAADQGGLWNFTRPVISTGADSSQLTCWSHGKSIATSLGADQLRSNHDTLGMEHSEKENAAKVHPYLPDFFEPKAGMPVRYRAPSLQRVVEFVEVEHGVDGFFPGGFLCPRTHFLRHPSTGLGLLPALPGQLLK
ncbi:uncharacterized protein BO88DRAFT_427929 [Aspergillus vadensis CBS 113365]|uniref:Uncharacterized protein n=1 Tax=Aspergillus vadensis (strain CBS 113365 / IMI 142717 / IBT 24658) TaxID=1448311 RepID=A0A319B2F8_ASPVC|nr:hypothetical protein BO88DRAFT_427929 [Aspergillus vadensis CBS 113365]PYH66425.1 hypothetical protein BO88DRAFT_427929 [Aspergillus vadensis CBS 113365]